MSSFPSSRAIAPNPYLLEFYALHETYDPSDLVQRDLYMKQRDRLRAKYAYAVPTGKAIEATAFFTPLVEPFAGTGYWASLLRRSGADVRASDLWVPNGSLDHEYFPGERTWTIVQEMDACASVRKYPDRTLFMCFPPPYGEAYDCLQAYTGSHVIYVGDQDWLYTGGAELQGALQQTFTKVRTVELPSWRGEKTELTIWSRYKL